MAVIDHKTRGTSTSRRTAKASIRGSELLTTTAPTTTYSHEVGKDLIPELAMRVYSSPLDSFREAISNAFDENSYKIVLCISDAEIVIEDWGNGIEDYDEFRKFGQASKKSRKGEVIGEKGLGKLSLLSLGKVVCFETNNGNESMKFYMTLQGFSSPTIYSKNTTRFVSHRGTKITISQPLKIQELDGLRSYLQKAFGLRLARGAKIIINNESIKPKYAASMSSEEFLFNLTKVKANAHEARVTGNLKASEEGKGIVDLHIDHVFITSLEVDTRRKFAGWVNCNALTPETSRNNIVQNGTYKEFIYLLRRHASRFSLREISIDEHKLMLSRELNVLLKNYLRDMRINVHGRSPHTIIDKNGADNKSPTYQNLDYDISGRRLDDSEGPLSIVQDVLDDSKNPSVKREKQKEDSPSNIAVRWEFVDLGNEKEPIYFIPPNVIYCNTSNDLYKFAMEKNRHYGPTWVRMLPYLARVAVAMDVMSCKPTIDQLNTKVDEATRYFLRQKKVI